jgi:hypothetical protein
MAIFRFDNLNDPMASHAEFLGRLGLNILVSFVLIGIALGVGMYGYHVLEKLSWLDAFLNSAMLLGGMGPVDTMHTEAGKLFAGIYALACGLVFVLASGIVLAPVAHRVLHALHVDDDDKGDDKS